MITNIISVTAIKILEDKITDWNKLPVRDLTPEETSFYSTEVQQGYGIQCGGVVVMQVMVGNRESGSTIPKSVPGDLTVRTNDVIRGMDTIAWKWVPTGNGNGKLEWISAAPPKTL